MSGDTAIAKLSVVGAGMIGHPGVAAKFFAALAQENINIQIHHRINLLMVAIA